MLEVNYELANKTSLLFHSLAAPRSLHTIYSLAGVPNAIIELWELSEAAV